MNTARRPLNSSDRRFAAGMAVVALVALLLRLSRLLSRIHI